MPPPPAAVPFRDRPVLEHIVEQHAEEAAFLWTLRDAATDAPHYRRHHLARLDERIEAHVDGLRVAGEAGWRIALEQLERRCEKGELFAAGVLALESGDMRRIESLVARAEAEPEARRGFVGAIAWCRPAALAPTVRNWNRSEADFGRYLALCACSVHRAGAGSDLDARVNDQSVLVRARALRLAGELGRIELLGACLDHLHGESGAAGFWAAWSAVLLGDRGLGLQTIRRIAPGDDPHRWTALELAVRAASAEHNAAYLRGLSGDARLRRAVVVAMGHSGDPIAVPWIMARMEEPELARVTGESFAMISGADLAEDGLERDTPPGESAPVPGDDVFDETAVGPDEHLPWPEPAHVRSWWDREGHRFTSGVRHLAGQPIGAAACIEIWSKGTQLQRRAAALEMALTRGDAALKCFRRKLFPQSRVT